MYTKLHGSFPRKCSEMAPGRLKARCQVLTLSSWGLGIFLTRTKAAAARDRLSPGSRGAWVLHRPGWGSEWSAEEAGASVVAPRAHGAASGPCGLSILIYGARFGVQGSQEREREREVCRAGGGAGRSGSLLRAWHPLSLLLRDAHPVSPRGRPGGWHLTCQDP